MDTDKDGVQTLTKAFDDEKKTETAESGFTYNVSNGAVTTTMAKSQGVDFGTKLVQYYTNEDGKVVVKAIIDMKAGTAYAAGQLKGFDGTTNLKSTSVATVVTAGVDKDGKATGKYTSKDYTGYKNFPALTAGYTYYEIKADTFIVAGAVVAAAPEVVHNYVYVKSDNGTVAEGHSYTVVVDGTEQDILVAKGTLTEKAVYVDLTITDGKVAEAPAAATKTDDAKEVVTVIDAAYFTTASGTYQYAKDAKIYNVTSSDATAVAKNDQVIYFTNDNDEATVVFIVGAVQA